MNDKDILKLKEQRAKLLKEVEQIDEVLEQEAYNKHIGIYVIEKINEVEL